METMVIVSVCDKEPYDRQAAIDFSFDDTGDALDFLKIALAQGFICQVENREV